MGRQAGPGRGDTGWARSARNAGPGRTSGYTLDGGDGRGLLRCRHRHRRRSAASGGGVQEPATRRWRRRQRRPCSGAECPGQLPPHAGHCAQHAAKLLVRVKETQTQVSQTWLDCIRSDAPFLQCPRCAPMQQTLGDCCREPHSTGMSAEAGQASSAVLLMLKLYRDRVNPGRHHSNRFPSVGRCRVQRAVRVGSRAVLQL